MFTIHIPYDNRTRSQVIILLYTHLSLSFLRETMNMFIWMKLLLLINLTSPFLSIWQIAIDTKKSHVIFYGSPHACVCVYIYFDVSIINIIMHMRMVINLFTQTSKRDIHKIPNFLIFNVGEGNSHQDFQFHRSSS